MINAETLPSGVVQIKFNAKRGEWQVAVHNAFVHLWRELELMEAGYREPSWRNTSANDKAWVYAGCEEVFLERCHASGIPAIRVAKWHHKIARVGTAHEPCVQQATLFA